MSPYSFPLQGKTVWVAGHRGMVGSAIIRRLQSEDVELLSVGRDELDLKDQAGVNAWVAYHKPQVVIIAAATVGGIIANSTRPAEFIYDNMMIECNLIESSYRNGAERVVLLGSSCIYPKFAPQPMKESALLTGELEPTNQWYAVAKIAGIRLAQAYRQQYGCDYISVMPTNLFGKGDNFNLTSSHVIPALMRKAHEAKVSDAPYMEVWGSGQVRREFMYVDDMADAVVHLAKHYSDEGHINIGVGQDITIAELARLVCEVVGFQGELRFDSSKPDGTPRKLLDVSRLAETGWSAQTPLRQGLEVTYNWFLENQGHIRT